MQATYDVSYQQHRYKNLNIGGNGLIVYKKIYIQNTWGHQWCMSIRFFQIHTHTQILYIYIYIGENPLGEQYKNAKCFFEWILEAVSYKTVAVRPFASHFTNYPSKTRHW